MELKDRVKALEELRFHLRCKRAGWAGRCAEVGDFTYAWNPKIWTWGEEAKLYIGKFCSIGENVQFILGGEHHTEWNTTYPFNVLLKDEYPTRETCAKTKGDIRIGNDVWIGNDAKIMSGVTIGDGAVIAGSAVVTKSIPPFMVAGGVPAKMIRYRTWHSVKWWDWPIEKLAEGIPVLISRDIEALILFDKEWKG